MATTQEVEKALVIWNISDCPIPDGLDPLTVVQRIQKAVEKSGYVRSNGEISITAFGNNLTESPGEDVMRKLSSIGISLKNSDDYQMHLYRWAKENPAPGTMMVIDRDERLGWLGRTFSGLVYRGFRFLLACPQRNPDTPFPSTFSKQWDWGAFISYEQETITPTTNLVYDKIRGSPWGCGVCCVSCPNLEELITHLKSVEHEFGVWDLHASHNGVDRFNPANLPLGRSKELDLLITQDMLRQTMPSLRRGRPLRPLRPELMFNPTHSKY